jgi:acyl carrier protein
MKEIAKAEIVTIIQEHCINQSLICAELAKKNEINGDMYLVDLGINSIDYVEISDAIVKELGVRLNLTSLSKTNKINDIADILFKEISQKQGRITAALSERSN